MVEDGINKMKEKIKNLILKLGSWYRYAQLNPQEGKQDIVPLGYRVEPITFNFGHKYYPYKVDSPDKYWTPSFVEEISKFKHYKLYTQFLPKKFDNVSIPYGIGVIESDSEYKYGYFTCKIKFPFGKLYAWPAFWLYGSDGKIYSEIDIVEAYSKKGDYEQFKKFESNVHYQYNENSWVNTGAKTHAISEYRMYVGSVESKELCINPDFIKFSLHWTKDFLRFYYDGYLVREITDKNILDKLVPMKVVINNSVETKYSPSNDSIMEVKDIEVWKEVE